VHQREARRPDQSNYNVRERKDTAGLSIEKRGATKGKEAKRGRDGGIQECGLGAWIRRVGEIKGTKIRSAKNL